MELLLKLPFCLAGVCALAYLFCAPKRLIPVAGVIGTLGYGLYLLLGVFGLPDLMRFFTATLLISLLSEIGAVVWKAPAVIFLSTSIFVLVPGLDLYKTVNLFVFGDYSAGAQTGIRTFLAIGAMAAAVAAGTLAMRVARRVFRSAVNVSHKKG